MCAAGTQPRRECRPHRRSRGWPRREPARRLLGVLDRLRPLRDLVWPASCAACGVGGQALCPACALDVAGLAQLRAHAPTPSPRGFPPTLTWGDYAGSLRRLVVAHKDEDRADAAPLLSAILGDVVEASLAGLPSPLLVPVPSSASSRRSRGREPLLDIAAGMSLSVAVPLVNALRVGRPVRDQAGLGHAERRANLDGSMALVPGVEEVLDGADIVLLDDVVTTGSTLAEAARAVRSGGSGTPRGGVRSVRAAVICATRRTK